MARERLKTFSRNDRFANPGEGRRGPDPRTLAELDRILAAYDASEE